MTDNDPLTYSLDTASAAVFTIDGQTGQVRTQAELDRETTASYRLTVSVSDGKDAAGDPDSATDATIDVVVTVTDAPGTVTLSSTRPLVGRALTASVDDPDSPHLSSHVALGSVGGWNDVGADCGGPRPRPTHRVRTISATRCG